MKRDTRVLTKVPIHKPTVDSKQSDGHPPYIYCGCRGDLVTLKLETTFNYKQGAA